MIVAREKKQNNIAEYILYMWQVEDLIRTHELDMKNIETYVIPQYGQNEEALNEIRHWYAGLIEMMKEENIREKGHFQFLMNIMNDLNEFHFRLLQSNQLTKYKILYQEALPGIQDYRKKSEPKDHNEIYLCLHAIYVYLLLKIKKTEISRETADTIKGFSKLLATLSNLYKSYNEGKLEL